MGVGVGVAVGPPGVGVRVAVGVGVGPALVFQFVRYVTTSACPERSGFCCQVTFAVTFFRFESTEEIVIWRVKISVVSDVPENVHWLPEITKPCVPLVKLEKFSSRIFLTASKPSSASITARVRAPERAVLC